MRFTEIISCQDVDYNIEYKNDHFSDQGIKTLNMPKSPCRNFFREI